MSENGKETKQKEKTQSAITEITLPSGKKATIRKGKVKNLRDANMMTSDPNEVAFALAAQLIEIDGAKITMEDILELEIPDWMEILPFLGLMPANLPEQLSKLLSTLPSATKQS